MGVLSQTSRPSRPEASAAELLADTVVRTRPWHRGTVTDAERTTTTASLGGRATGAAARVSSSWASTSSSMSSRGTVDREREREISSSKMFQRGASGAYYPLTEGLETSRNHSSDLELLGAMRGFLP